MIPMVFASSFGQLLLSFFRNAIKNDNIEEICDVDLFINK